MLIATLLRRPRDIISSLRIVVSLCLIYRYNVHTKFRASQKTINLQLTINSHAVSSALEVHLKLPASVTLASLITTFRLRPSFTIVMRLSGFRGSLFLNLNKCIRNL